jgi:hypothetical protein
MSFKKKEESMKSRLGLPILLLLTAVSLAQAANPGTAAEAKAMLQKAVDHYKSVGREKALGDFTAGKAPFRDRDLYVVCVGDDHVISANAGFPQYVGQSADILKDATGKALGRAIVDAVATKTSGVVEFKMPSPTTGKIAPKVLFVEKLQSDVCGVGAYGSP